MNFVHFAQFQFNGFNMMFPDHSRPFNNSYRCYSVSMLPGNERQDVEKGGKSNVFTGILANFIYLFNSTRVYLSNSFVYSHEYVCVPVCLCVTANSYNATIGTGSTDSFER